MGISFYDICDTLCVPLLLCNEPIELAYSN